MKKLSFLLLTLVIGLSACKKSSDNFDAAAQAATDDAAIQAYIKANNITATKDASGLYYQIINQGTGAYPNTASTVQVNFIGRLLDGTIFDQTTALTGSRSLALSGTVTGWQIGVPLVRAGGRIMLLVPSALGYGNNTSGSVPVNAVLIFTIDLLSTK